MKNCLGWLKFLFSDFSYIQVTKHGCSTIFTEKTFYVYKVQRTGKSLFDVRLHENLNQSSVRTEARMFFVVSAPVLEI